MNWSSAGRSCSSTSLSSKQPVLPTHHHTRSTSASASRSASASSASMPMPMPMPKRVISLRPFRKQRGATDDEYSAALPQLMLPSDRNSAENHCHDQEHGQEQMDDGNADARSRSRRNISEPMVSFPQPQPPPKTSSDDRRAVGSLEGCLRQALLLILAFLIGTIKVEWHDLVLRTAEYLTVAWMTCIVLIVMTKIKAKASSATTTRTGAGADADTATRSPRIPDERTPLLFVPPATSAGDVMPFGEDRTVLGHDNNTPTHQQHQHHAADDDTVLLPAQPMLFPHPSLEPLHVINHDTDERIIPNHGAFPMENSMWSGSVVLLIRTPDVDDPDAAPGTEENEATSSYFRDKQRRFEFQFQLKLRDVPKGRVFFGCELEEPIKMGIIQRAFVTASMAFMKKMNNTFHYSITGQKPLESGMYEKPHMAFTVEGSMDRLVVTKPGDAPPTLGGAIYEDPESIKRRKKGGRIDWNTQDTYTFALWSAYVDFLEWKSMNLPGIRPFLLSSVIGTQHINMVIYDIAESSDKHHRCDMNLISGIELSNTLQNRMGPRATKSAGASRTKAVDDEAPDNEEEFEDELDDEAATVAELGEGLYLRSGDTVVLQESTKDGRIGGTVASGGGFAIIQNNATCAIVIEKARLAKRRATLSAHARQNLIKTGDTVLVKLMTYHKNTNKTEVRYLSIHRGWWLKWVTDEPTKNGYFTIHTLETEFIPDDKPLEATSETQSSYLTLGGSFSLRHKRWGGFHVGVSAEESPTYGGRMLGIYSPTSQRIQRSGSASDDELDVKPDADDQEVTQKGNWLLPLRICAHISSASLTTPTAANTDATSAFTFDNVVEPSGSTKLIAENFQVDVPIWIETMNRTERSRQLAYVVRVLVDEPLDREEDSPKSFIRLRTGGDLAGIMRLGMSWRGDEQVGKKLWLRRRTHGSGVFSPRAGHRTDNDESEDEDNGVAPGTPNPPTPPPLSPRRQTTHGSVDGLDMGSELDLPEWDGAAGGEAGELSDYSEEDEDDAELENINETLLPQKHMKGRRIIEQIAKSVKSGTVTTGMQVMKQSKKAGKALVGPISRARPKKPPAAEPKSRKVKTPGRTYRRKEAKDHHIVLSRTMKQIGKKKRKAKVWLSEPPRVLAGQLSAPDQSCRTASHVISRMSPSASNGNEQVASILAEQIADQSDLDRSFLQGGAAQLGVVCSEKELLFDCLAARCLWDSHWREEWLGIYRDCVVFFAPMTKKAALQLAAMDIRKVRLLCGSRELSPLPGYPIAVIETAWQCYYAAFPNQDVRDTFIEKLNDIIMPTSEIDDCSRALENALREKDLWKARFWQGFQDSAESTLSGGKRKWAKVPSGKKMLDRSILNGRRFVFDVDPWLDDDLDDEMARMSAFAGELLSTALSMTTTILENNPGAFVKFLDMTSQLRSLPLQRLDLARPEAFCIFVNIYHCLLQHSLVVTVSGPLYKKSAGHFMRSTCYEIGGDVFSLAELQYCVIRGKMSKPTISKFPYLEAPRKSAAYRFYALDYTDPRVNFVLNTGDVSCPITIPVLKSEKLEEQLHDATCVFIQKEVDIDKIKGVFVLPKIMDVYRHDFGAGDSTSFLSYCTKYLEEDDQRVVKELKDNPALLHVKFQPCAEQYHIYLKPIETSVLV